MKYHRIIGFPKSLVFPNGILNLIYTKHADEKSQFIFGDEKIMHDLFDHIYANKDWIIEVTTDDNIICKSFVTRYRVAAFDIVLVVKILTNHTGLVITVWDNNTEDNHETLDKSKYDLPDNNNSKEIDLIYAGQ
jgi:hypothetical protein